MRFIQGIIVWKDLKPSFNFHKAGIVFKMAPAVKFCCNLSHDNKENTTESFLSRPNINLLEY